MLPDVHLRRLLMFLLLVSAAGACPAIEVGDTAPDWELARPDGSASRFHLESSGSVSVVLFWATWCPYCRTLMPHLQKVAEDFRQRGVRFYALSVWEDGDVVDHMARHGFTFDLLLAAETAARDWGVKGTPGLFVVGPDGRVLYRRNSGDDDLDVEFAVREILALAIK